MTILEGHAQRWKDALDDGTLESEVAVILDIASEVGTLSESIGELEEIVAPDAMNRETRDLQAVVDAVVHDDREERTVTVSVAVEDDDENERGAVHVRDGGPAIPAVEKEILDADVDTSNTDHGSGVGLWVMKWCVESLGGELSFAANEPRGNLVSLALPRAEPPGGA